MVVGWLGGAPLSVEGAVMSAEMFPAYSKVPILNTC
eukprot:COSAG01_NODE_2168_length_8243_cov_2.796442_4_plen_36_part_00